MLRTINTYCFLFLLLFQGALLPAATENAPLPLHEVHISKCQIDYNGEEKALQMSLYIFADDLEEALQKDGIEKLFLCTEKEKEKADEYLLYYLQKHFGLTVNQQATPYEFVGKEPSEDLQGIWVYLEITEIEKLSEITVRNSLLTELFADQKNIINITVPSGPSHFFIFERGKSEESVNYGS